MRPSNCQRGLVDTHLQTDSLVRTARLRSPHSSTACVTHCNRQLQHTSNQHVQSSASSVEHDAQHRQSGPSAADHLAWALRLPSLYVVRDSHQPSAGEMAGMASGSLSAINQYTGERMLQLSSGTRQLNPFTEVVWQRGPRRWGGLRKGHPIRIERPAPWLLDLRHHWDNIQCNTSDAVTYVMGLRHRLCSLQFAASDVLVAAALLAGLVLAALLLRKALQRQGRQQAEPREDPEVLARKAASLDLQRSRFRRALGADDEMEPTAAAGMSSASTQAEQHAPADSAVSEPGLDDFDAWDEDTQKQWKRFMKGSRSQEIEEEQWWDIDRDEVPPDRPVYQDFN